MEYIVEYDNALPLNICDLIINFFESNKDVHINGRIQDGKINNNILISNDILLDYNLEKYMNYHLEKYFIKYMNENKYNNSINLINEKWIIKKYKKNIGFFDWHIDNVPLPKTRMLSIIYYLNDIDNGGETSFKIENKIVNIKPKKGKLIIFPSNYPYIHKGNIPISNDKYILVTFLNIKNTINI
jgi:hypothetical protein